MSFFGELGRRNVFRVSIAYAIVAWIVVQIADIVFETIGAPAWVMQTLMLGLVLGFVVALIFSWAYEVTPEGVKRESEIDRSQSITGVTGGKLDRVIMGLLVVALAYFVWESRLSDRPTAVQVADEPAEVIEETTTPISDLSIAVLPFENRSNLAEDEFFVEGMHDDLLTTLAKIGSMKVISRTSVMEYRDGSKKIPQIAEELGVANILEGGVQRAGNQVRINVQLIDAETDEHLWAEIYDRELSAENLFAIQSEISRAIADALHATLSPEEERRIDTVPTDSLDAFDHYLRGRTLMATRAVDALEESTREFLKAVELDPGFALAWVGVADSHNLLSGYADLPYGTYFEIRDDAINRALDIDPLLGEAFASLGSLMSAKGDLVAAEEALRKSIQYAPNYATGYHWLSNMIRRNLLRAPEALRYALKAAELDPNSAVILSNLTGSYGQMGDYDSALRVTTLLLDKHPENQLGHSSLAWQLEARGDFVGGLEARKRSLELDPGSAAQMSILVDGYVTMGAWDEAEHALKLMAERFPGNRNVDITEIFVRLPQGGARNTRETLSATLQENPNEQVAYLSALVAMYSGEYDLALDGFAQMHDGDPTSVQFDSSYLGLVSYNLCYIALSLLETDGYVARGEELIARTIDFYENDLPDEIANTERLGVDLCYLLAGDTASALDIIERQLVWNDSWDWPWDHLLPPYDAIRDHPRYVAAWDEFERRMAEQLEELRSKDKAKPAFEF